jgi:hypothetical protein
MFQLLRRARVPLMPRFQVEDDFYDDPAANRAGTAALGLYYRCGNYVARKLLDGFVPADVSTLYGTPEWVRKLTDVGLWLAVPGGHDMPRYHSHGNPTRAKVLADREAKSQRQQRWLENQRNGRSETRRVSRRADRPSHDASRDGPEDAALPPSLTGRKGRSRSNGASAPRAAEIKPKPPWCGECDERTRLTPDTPDAAPMRCAACHPLAKEAATP